MPLAISLIVAGYVRLGDCDALEKLRAHRDAMLAEMSSVTGLDVSRMLDTINEEIALIDAGLSELNARHEERTSASGGTPPAQGEA